MWPFTRNRQAGAFTDTLLNGLIAAANGRNERDAGSGERYRDGGGYMGAGVHGGSRASARAGR